MTRLMRWINDNIELDFYYTSAFSDGDDWTTAESTGEWIRAMIMTRRNEPDIFILAKNPKQK